MGTDDQIMQGGMLMVKRFQRSSQVRARLHETRSELRLVWDFTSVWGNIIASVHMTTGATVNVRSKIKFSRIIKVDN